MQIAVENSPLPHSPTCLCSRSLSSVVVLEMEGRWCQADVLHNPHDRKGGGLPCLFNQLLAVQPNFWSFLKSVFPTVHMLAVGSGRLQLVPDSRFCLAFVFVACILFIC
jgi:hypothetical protein